MSLNYKKRGEETAASVETGFLMAACASEDKVKDILGRYALSGIEGVDEGFDALGENDYDAFFEGIDDPREEDIFSPEFIGG